MNTVSTDHAPSAPIACVDTRVPTFTLTRTAAAIRLGLATGALALAATPALAQQTTVEDSERDVTTLQSITVQGMSEIVEQYAGEQVATGGRMGFLGDRDFMETPFSAISYTDKYIADQQAHDIIEVIAKTDPSVFSSRIAGESQESYSIRGLDSSVSDVTLNGLAGMAAYYRNSPEMYERIEVHKGPSALLNGMPPKGSAGGTVNLVTKRAGEDPLTRLTGTYSSESHTGGHVDIGRRFGDSNQLGVRFNSVYRDGEMAIEGQEKRVTMNSLGLDWRGERTRLSADLYQSKDQANGLTRGLTLASGVDLPSPPDPDVTWNPPWAFYESTDKGAMIRGEFDLTDNLSTYATLGTSKTELDTNMGVGQLYNDAGDFTINFSGVADRMRRKSAEIGLQGNAETGAVAHQFAVNATYYNEDYRLNGFRNLLPVAWQTNIYNPVWGPAPTLPSNIMAITQTDTKLTSFGLADTLSFAEERLQLTLGVRRQQVVTDSYNGSTGARLSKRYDEDATTPAIAVLFKVTEQISLYANYIEGLSQGSIAPNTADNAGEVFAPYKTKQREVGVKFDLGSFAHTLSVYEIERPSSYTDPVTNVFSFGGEQRNRGVEWGFFGAPLDRVRLMGGIAYSEAEITKASTAANEGQQAVGLPEWQGKIGAEWDVPMLSGLTLTANATSVSEQYLNADNSMKIPGYTVFDLGARHSSNAWGHPLTLRAAVTNVGNKAYWAKPHYTSLALGAPRTATLSATVDF